MNSLIFGELCFFRRLPAVESIVNVTIGDFSGERNLDAEGFLRLFARAVPLKPFDPDGWQYAPWCSGDFMSGGGRYRFTLFLGGRGLLTAPDGRRGLISFLGSV
jgi:hypothetical protein